MRAVENSKNLNAKAFRRSPFVIFYWINRALVFENYATGKKVAGEPFVTSILHFCGQSRTLAELLRNFPDENPVALRGCIRQLLKHSLLERSPRKNRKDLEGWENWAPWNPSAGYFHFSTKDTPYERGAAEDLSRPEGNCRQKDSSGNYEEISPSTRDPIAPPLHGNGIPPSIAAEAHLARIFQQSREPRFPGTIAMAVVRRSGLGECSRRGPPGSQDLTLGGSVASARGVRSCPECEEHRRGNLSLQFGGSPAGTIAQRPGQTGNR